MSDGPWPAGVHSDARPCRPSPRPRWPARLERAAPSHFESLSFLHRGGTGIGGRRVSESGPPRSRVGSDGRGNPEACATHQVVAMGKCSRRPSRRRWPDRARRGCGRCRARGCSTQRPCWPSSLGAMRAAPRPTGVPTPALVPHGRQPRSWVPTGRRSERAGPSPTLLWRMDVAPPKRRCRHRGRRPCDPREGRHGPQSAQQRASRDRRRLVHRAPFDFEQVFARAQRRVVAPGTEAPVVDLDALIAMKTAAARGLDLADVRPVESIRERIRDQGWSPPASRRGGPS